MPQHRIAYLFIVTLFSIVFYPLSAYAERWNVDQGNLISKGTGAVIEGYDPVAYFKDGAAQKGNPDISVQHEGGTFFFATTQNRDAFKADPAKYTPQYGGFCAYAAGEKNELVEVDPTAWKIVNGKLYLNYDESIQKTWEKNQDNFITKADANWPKLSQ